MSGFLIAGFIFLNLSSLQAQESPLFRRIISQEFVVSDPTNIIVAFFDADSTLRVSKSGSVSANGPDDFEILPGVAAEIKKLNDAGILVVVVSNQGGIPKYISLETADLALKNLKLELPKEGARIDYFDFSENDDEDRKPKIGMGHRLEKILKEKFGPQAQINKSKSFMVGDSAWKKGETRPDGKPGSNFSNSDKRFAENYGIAFHEPADFFGWREYQVDVINSLKECQALFARMTRKH